MRSTTWMLLVFALLASAELPGGDKPPSDHHSGTTSNTGQPDIPGCYGCPYFAKAAVQQSMLTDPIRVGGYYEAIATNNTHFQGSTVIDVGAGSGVLSYFALQAGAYEVHAVEPSNAVDIIRAVAASNPDIGARLRIHGSYVEELDLPPASADVIVSEPFGAFLLTEALIFEAFLSARDRFLKSDGKMYPEAATLYLAPFSDHGLVQKVVEDRTRFWQNTNYFGVDLRAVASIALRELLSQPIHTILSPTRQLAGAPAAFPFDFYKLTKEYLAEFSLPLAYEVRHPYVLHGLAGWFDLNFPKGDSADNFRVLSTAPTHPQTVWGQNVILLRAAIAVNPGDTLNGTITFTRRAQSYSAKVFVCTRGGDLCTDSEHVDLKDPTILAKANVDEAKPGFSSLWRGADPGDTAGSK